MEQIWHCHCREREREHTQQMNTLRSRLHELKSQMSKLRREMSNLETEIKTTDRNRAKEVAREKELTQRFRRDLGKV